MVRIGKKPDFLGCSGDRVVWRGGSFLKKCSKKGGAPGFGIARSAPVGGSARRPSPPGGVPTLGLGSDFYDTTRVCNPEALFGGKGVPPPPKIQCGGTPYPQEGVPHTSLPNFLKKNNFPQEIGEKKGHFFFRWRPIFRVSYENAIRRHFFGGKGSPPLPTWCPN